MIADEPGLLYTGLPECHHRSEVPLLQALTDCLPGRRSRQSAAVLWKRESSMRGKGFIAFVSSDPATPADVRRKKATGKGRREKAGQFWTPMVGQFWTPIDSQLLPIKDVCLANTPKDCTNHTGPQGMALDVVGEQPCTCVCHFSALDQVQVLQCRDRLDVIWKPRSAGELLPILIIQSLFQIKASEGCFFEPDEPFLEEKLADFLARHLLAVPALADE